MIVMGYWTYVEIAMGIIISCLPVLPRLFQAFGPRIYGAFSFRSKTSTHTETQTAHTPIKSRSGKKSPDGYVDLDYMRPEISGEYAPLHEHGPRQPEGRVMTNDFSPQNCPAPAPESMNGEKQRGRILRTTRIETEMEPQISAINVSRADFGGW